jgi:hypothetical protein
VLDIDVNDFGDVYDAWHIEDLKRRFAVDAGRNGVKLASEHYSRYAAFRPDWADQCADEIAEWDRYYSGTEKLV